MHLAATAAAAALQYPADEFPRDAAQIEQNEVGRRNFHQPIGMAGRGVNQHRRFGIDAVKDLCRASFRSESSITTTRSGSSMWPR